MHEDHEGTCITLESNSARAKVPAERDKAKFVFDSLHLITTMVFPGRQMKVRTTQCVISWSVNAVNLLFFI